MPYNSTIILKPRRLDCGCFGYAFSKNKCKFHAQIDNAKKRIEKSNNQKSKPIITDNTEQDLKQWYAMVAEEIAKHPFCWETGEFISIKDYRAASCHIFPKAIFRSIAAHPLNFLVLSPRNGSHDKTHRLDKFSTMNVWGEAVRRFKIFEIDIKEKHKYLELFKSYIS